LTRKAGEVYHQVGSRDPRERLLWQVQAPLDSHVVTRGQATMNTLPDIYRRVQTSKAESLVLQTLAVHPRMSYEALAAATGYSVRWVIELVRRLEERHLLRVKRRWIGVKRMAINVYQVVRPWLREVFTRENLERKRSTVQTFSERNLQGQPTRRENKAQKSGHCSHDECLKAGLTEGSEAYKAARGFPPP
jgi:hypothetical protein